MRDDVTYANGCGPENYYQIVAESKGKPGQPRGKHHFGIFRDTFCNFGGKILVSPPFKSAVSPLVCSISLF